MRLAKKIIYWFMALFPILTLLLPLPMTFQAFRADSETSEMLNAEVLDMYLRTGNYYATKLENGTILIEPENSTAGYCTVISENVFKFKENYEKPMQQTILKLGYQIRETTGYSMEIFLAVFSCMYHLFFMYIIEFLMALICFIPKKCSELFGG